jgi:hypothetical protein
MEIKKVEKYVNPTNVPKTRDIQISPNDPRNTEDYKKISPDNFLVVPDNNLETIDGTPDDYLNTINLAGYDITDFTDYVDIQPPIIIGKVEAEDYVNSSVPQNLYLDVTSFTIDDNAGAADGSVRWKASLYFDDVIGAQSYEYDMVGVES